MISKETTSFPVSIFMAGDAETAAVLCRQFCDSVGLCVTVTSALYVYTGGEEAGFVVGLINYPRFPASPFEISATAQRLADHLRINLGQDSYSIHSPLGTVWHSWRGEE
jgi:hypothetical protein